MDKVNTSDTLCNLPRRCLALYSGGLDSIVSVKLVAEQGIEVIPLFFATPFFGSQALLDPDKFRSQHIERYGIHTNLVDYTEDFIRILAAPRHGYGKHFNPCIDCKIGMLKRARELLSELQAAFVITGEVLGQRPMSQRRDAMHIIERDTGLKDLLLRPLCAKHLQPTLPERCGLINREKLLHISGRGRKIQEDLAHRYGISDIPNPAGGCLLTYAQSAFKVRHTFERFANSLPSPSDLWLDVLGRKFKLDNQTYMAVARDEHECNQLERMDYPGNIFMRIFDVPGPICIIRGVLSPENLKLAAGICLRYTKARGQGAMKAIWGPSPTMMDNFVLAPLLGEALIRDHLLDEHMITGDEG